MKTPSDSNVLTINGSGQAVIQSTNPAIVKDAQAISVLLLAGTATTSNGAVEAVVNFVFDPACVYSPIVSTQTYPPFTVTSGGTIDFELNSASYTY